MHFFYTPLAAENLSAGARNLSQASGLGKMKSNTLFIGFKRNWQSDCPQNLDHYIRTIDDPFDFNCGICLLRRAEGLEISRVMHTHVNPGFENETTHSNRIKICLIAK